MKRCFVFLLLGALLALSLGLQATAQEPQEKKAQAKTALDRLNGRIQMINKETSTITLVRANVKRTVLYTPNTKITMQNKPSTMDELKEGRRVIVLGKFGPQGQLNAARIDIRD